MINYGSGRKVYRFKNNKVIKIPKNKNGFLQNIKEVEIYIKYKESTFSCFLTPCSLINYDGKLCVIMDELHTWSKEELENDEKFYDITNLFYEFDEDIELLEEMLDILVFEEGLVEEDLTSLSNWGEREDGKLALVDFGWTYDMAKQFS